MIMVTLTETRKMGRYERILDFFRWSYLQGLFTINFRVGVGGSCGEQRDYSSVSGLSTWVGVVHFNKEEQNRGGLVEKVISVVLASWSTCERSQESCQVGDGEQSLEFRKQGGTTGSTGSGWWVQPGRAGLAGQGEKGQQGQSPR